MPYMNCFINKFLNFTANCIDYSFLQVICLNIWGIIVITVILMIIIYSFFYFRFQKFIKIKKQQNARTIQRTAEIEQQQEEIRAQAEQLERQNRELEKLSTVVRETHNAVMIMDSRGNFEWVNRSFEKIYGYSFSELIEARGKSLIDASASPNIKKIFSVLRKKKETIIYESLMISKQGEQVWSQTTLTPILDENNEIIKIVGIDTDITEQKKAEEKIKKQRDENARQKEEITDSIQYAKRLQKAIFPSKELLRENLQEYFILHLPKSIVSGDFY